MASFDERMFTGIVKGTGDIVSIEERGSRTTVGSKCLLKDLF